MEELLDAGVEEELLDARIEEELLDAGIEEELIEGGGAELDDGVGVGVGEGVGVGVGLGVGVEFGVELGDAELLSGSGGGAAELECGVFGDCGAPPAPLAPPLIPPSNTTKLAVAPFGTVTTQKFAPPAPSVLVPSISLTECLEGSIAQGRPLQLPSQTISTPHVGISFRKGVAGSR